jgi:hypothetical protein
VAATYRNGLLDLRLPLRESVKPRKIEIALDAEKNDEKQLAGVV